MKIKYRILYFLMILPIVVTLIVLPALPNQLPAHYDFVGNITRWGSKYEMLISPVITFLFGLFWLAMAGYCRKEDKKSKAKNLPARNEKIIIVVGIATLMYFNGLAYTFIYNGYFEATQLSKPFELDLYKVLSTLMGIAFIIIGNILPKCKMNSFVGLRTSWSMANEKAWFLSQRMGGLSLTITGIIITLACLFFFQNSAALLFSMICITVCVLWCVIYSKIAYTKSMEEK